MSKVAFKDEDDFVAAMHTAFPGSVWSIEDYGQVAVWTGLTQNRDGSFSVTGPGGGGECKCCNPPVEEI